MLDSIAFKKWDLVLSGETILDPTTFIIASLMPFSFMKVHSDGTTYLAVDLADVKQHTNTALRGFKFLVEKGSASWLHISEPRRTRGTNFEDTTEGVLAIGVVKRMKVNLICEEALKSELQTTKTHKSTPVGQTDYLKEIYDAYKANSDSLGFGNSAVVAYSTVRSLIASIRTGKATRLEMLKYFYYVNYMHLCMTTFPSDNDLQKMHKELATATTVLKTLTPDEAINIVPYFVYNYPSYASKNFSDVNIYTLKFTLTTTLSRMRGMDAKKRVTQEQAKSKFGKDDRL